MPVDLVIRGAEIDIAIEGDFIAAIEHALGLVAVKQYLPIQPGDVVATHADVSALRQWTGLSPATSLAEGLGRFVDWYRGYFRAA